MSNRVIWGLLFAAATLTGCTHSYNVRFQMDAANRAVVVVSGNSPFVTVQNRGPGSVEVTFEQDGEPIRDRAILPAEAASTINRAARVVLESADHSSVEVEVLAERSTGLSIEQFPAPTSK